MGSSGDLDVEIKQANKFAPATDFTGIDVF